MTITKYHPNSDYGKLSKLLNSNNCICGIGLKDSGKPFCSKDFQNLIKNHEDIARRLRYSRDEERLEAYIDALEALGYKVSDIR